MLDESGAEGLAQLLSEFLRGEIAGGELSGPLNRNPMFAVFAVLAVEVDAAERAFPGIEAEPRHKAALQPSRS